MVIRRLQADNAVTGHEEAADFPEEEVVGAQGTVYRPDSARPWIHLVFFVLCFFLASHDPRSSGFDVLDVEAASETYAANAGSGPPGRQVAFLLLGLYSMYGLPLFWRNRLRVSGFAGACAAALLAWTLVSVVWAANPGDTLTKLFGVVVLTLTALQIKLRFNPRQIVVGLTTGSLVYMVFGLLCEIALGNFKPWQVAYRFHGTSSPTEEAVNCSIGLIGTLYLWRWTPRQRVWFWMLCVSVVFSLLTKSRTATLGAIVALLFSFVATRRIWQQRWMVGSSLAATVLLGAWLQINGLVSFAADSLQFGRDPTTSDTATLTGRVPLWAELMNFVKQHPIVGSGFGGFWTGPHIADISVDQGWAISAAHSAYVDILLSLGAVGLALYSLCLILAIVTTQIRYQRGATLGAAYFSTLLSFIVINGFTDSESVYVSSSLFFCFILSLTITGFQQQAIRSAPRLPAKIPEQPTIGQRPRLTAGR